MYSQIDSNKRKTIFLMVVFLAFVIFIGWFVGIYLGYGHSIFTIAIVVSILMTVISFFQGDKIALKSTGAIEIQKNDNPYVYRLVENLCITAGMPMPKVYIIESTAMNAFATGRDPKHASIALTKGLIDKLENEELEGVMAHELSHIQNYDTLLMTVVVVLVGIISLVSEWFFRARMHGGSRRSDSKSAGDGRIMAVIMIIGLILLILSPIIAELIKFAISRKREFMADASGSLLTRYPEGLARALEKISKSNIPLQTASRATAHLFISNPLKTKSWSNLFSTHPPIQERIAKLRAV